MSIYTCIYLHMIITPEKILYNNNDQENINKYNNHNRNNIRYGNTYLIYRFYIVQTNLVICNLIDSYFLKKN